MIKNLTVWTVVLILLLVSVATGQVEKCRIFVVSSYHAEYLWSQDTQKGVCAGLIEFGFLENQEQAAEFTKTNTVESTTSVVKKVWMDTKRKNSRSEIAGMVNIIMREIGEFKPDMVLLGDDNAANYIGNQLIDTEIPVVFWGINGMPLKYGLLNSVAEPGHNITGVYQAGYLKECLVFLKQIAPAAKTFAVLSDDSPTGRSKAKALQNLHEKKQLPLKLVECVITNNLAEWKKKALELESQVDAFFLLNHNSLKDKDKKAVDPLEIGAWYLRNIEKPECSQEKQFAIEGMLCVCDDSGYNQGYEAMKLVNRILKQKEQPATMAVKAPPRGPFIINKERAKMLGIELKKGMGAEEYVEKSLAMKKYPVILKN